MITVFFVDIKEKINNTKLEQHMQLVSPEKRARFQGKLNIHTKLSIYAELLLRTQIFKDLKLQNRDIVFALNKYGKPYLINYSHYYFNISHTNSAIVIAFSDNQIGIDIERVHNADLKIARRFFCTNEEEYIMKEPHDQNKRFYEIWTRKEAYIKYIGKGLSTPLTSFDVLDKDLNVKIHTKYKKDYIISTCSSDKHSPVLITLSEQDIEILVEDTLT